MDLTRLTRLFRAAPDALTVARDAATGMAPVAASPLPDADALRRETPASPGIATGSVVRDRYRLESLIGAGAMGQVWKARDLLLEEAHDPRPFVAIKLLSRDMQRHEDAYVALQREAGKARALAHPNIATVFTFDVDPGSGLAFIAMELLSGKPLDQLIREEPGGVPRERALAMIRGLASGLAYAHARGIVHCDFKPGNAFATSDGVAKILDFGIARLARDADRAEDAFDAGRFSALTPRYATREMLTGQQAHTADDVYALGLVAYELLSGRHPFGGRAADEVAAQGLGPAPLKDIGRREWRAIDRALALDRNRRWPDAQAFAEALEGVSPWVPALGALAAALAVAAAYSGYVGYAKSRPDVPFEALPQDVQLRFQQAMDLGDYAYRAGTEALSGSEALGVIYDAVSQYADAYATHPRNPDAARALERALAAFGTRLDGASSSMRAEARAGLQSLVERHQVLAQYSPLVDLIEELR
jgi:hypothetical protein